MGGRLVGGKTCRRDVELRSGVLNVGGALVSDVVLAILRLDPHAYHDLVVRSGEIGEALSHVWDARPRQDSRARDANDAHNAHDHHDDEDLAPATPAASRWDSARSGGWRC